AVGVESGRSPDRAGTAATTGEDADDADGTRSGGALAREAAGVHAGDGADARAGDWCERGDLRRDQLGAGAAAAVSGPGPDRDDPASCARTEFRESGELAGHAGAVPRSFEQLQCASRRAVGAAEPDGR